MIPRKWRHIVLIILILTALPFVFNVFYYSFIDQAPVSTEILVEARGFRKPPSGKTGFNAINVKGDADPLKQEYGKSRWRFQKRLLIKELYFVIPPTALQNLDSLQIKIGRRKFTIPKQTIEEKWQRKGKVRWTTGENSLIFIVPKSISTQKSKIFPFINAINWAGDRHFKSMLLKFPVPFDKYAVFPLALVIAAVIAYFLKPDSLQRLFYPAVPDETPLKTGASKIEKYTWWAGGMAFVILALVYLEKTDPFYFCRDDNFSYFMPPMIQGCESLFKGVFPLWNPCQFMGAPTASVGMYSLTYPPTYLSYLTADKIFGNKYHFMDVFCWMHVLAGYIASYWAFRTAGMRPSISTAGATAMTLSGFSLICGRSQYFMIPVLVWLPLLTVSLLYLKRGRTDWKWIAGTGAVMGLFFNAGQAQVWTYGITFYTMAAAFLYILKKINAKKIIYLVPALLSGAAISIPLFAMQITRVLNWKRVSLRSNTIGLDGLWAMIAPYPMAQAGHPEKWGNTDLNLMGHLYYSGTVFTTLGLAALVLILGWLLVFKTERRIKNVIARNHWLLYAGISTLMLFGREGLLWSATATLPLFEKFRYPFKFIPFANFFFIIGAGLIIERFLRTRKKPHYWGGAAAFALMGLIIYHLTLCTTSFYTFGDKPYPPMPAEMKALLPDADAPKGRIISLSPWRSPVKGYTLSLKNNFPTVYNIPAMEGSSQMILKAREMFPSRIFLFNEPVSACRVYGVTHFIAHRTSYKPVTTKSNDAWFCYETLAKESEKILRRLIPISELELENKNVEIWSIPKADPIAFINNPGKQRLKITMDCSGCRVLLPEKFPGGKIVINVLWWPEFNAYADGRMIKTQKDRYQRVLLSVPEGTEEVSIRFEPHIKTGLIAGAIILYLALGSYVLIRRKQKT